MSIANWLEAAGRDAVSSLLERAGRGGGQRRPGKRRPTPLPPPVERLEERRLLSAPAAFLPQATFATGSSPVSVVSADVNGDGTPDLIVANYSGNSVGVLLGNGNGTYYIKTYAVTVVNGQLTLLFKDLGGNDPYSVIDGLDVVAA